jgi:ribosomal-protein-alanine N-acetyltransferase
MSVETDYHSTFFTKFPSIRTPHLELIQITEEHANDLYKLFGDENVIQYYNLQPLESAKDSFRLIEYFKKRFELKAAIRWGIRLNDANAIIGTVGYNNFAKNHRANIGYDLQYEYWNLGIITEAMHAVISFGFYALGINRIEAEVMQGNERSIQVLNKIGFKQEGTLREWMYWNDRHYDMLMFSMLRSERPA